MKSACLSVIISFFITGFATAGNSPIDKGSTTIGGISFIQYQSGEAYETRDGQGLMTLAIFHTAGFFLGEGVLIGGEIN